MAAGAGAFVEIVEYIGSIIIDNANVGDQANNMQDLIADLLGSAVALAIMVPRRSHA